MVVVLVVMLIKQKKGSQNNCHPLAGVLNFNVDGTELELEAHAPINNGERGRSWSPFRKLLL